MAKKLQIWTNLSFREVILGTYDVSSSLRILKHQEALLTIIFDLVVEYVKSKIQTDSSYVLRGEKLRSEIRVIGNLRTLSPKIVQFPPPISSIFSKKNEELHVNMMPFIMGNHKTLPKNCRRYSDIIDQCLDCCPQERNQVGYLTIHESLVLVGKSQRRGGLHVEAPDTGLCNLQGFGAVKRFKRELAWGRGIWKNKPEGGIFIASSIADSCEVWNSYIERVEKEADSVVGPFGDIEHLRSVLDENKSIKLAANELVWITDRTPHESLPLSKTNFRQFFRLVTSNVTVWYADHSTQNPSGVQPTAQIITGNKFDL